MSPAPGGRLLRFVGDKAKFQLSGGPAGARGFLRTNIGRAAALRAETIEAHNQQVAAHGLPVAHRPAMPVLQGASWRDLPMRKVGDMWELELTVAEVGYFQAKAFFIDEKGRQHWPWGPNAGITVHPDAYRMGNTIYCAFPRMFGPTKALKITIDEQREGDLRQLDRVGYTVIPPSGKLRDLARELPHIVQTLGCKILHLLPVSPTPTTYARFGRFGSPYAVQDLTAIDPALVEFDKRTTGIQQFEELVYAAHMHGARVFLDLVINHTGWGSAEQERHPEWFVKEHGNFISPGAWGTTWEDLVELDHRLPISWEYLAEVFLTWCRRGVDGFRCDAGYKVPPLAWKYITARVRDEFPDALFLLEGLGGSWEATETLLTEGGLQWAYSELFQNYNGPQVGNYLEYANTKSETVGLFVHYSETHDNDRLAKKGRAWSVLRNQLCALTSYSGAFGFTCGVEWLAPERVNVHSSRGLAWGSGDNIVPELAQLNRLLLDHPCFYDGAKLTRLFEVDSTIYGLHRESAEGLDHLLVLVNLDDRNPHKAKIDKTLFEKIGKPLLNLLSEKEIAFEETKTEIAVRLEPAQAICLAPTLKPLGLRGEEYARKRAQAAFAIQAVSQVLSPEEIGAYNWKRLAELADHDPVKLLASISTLEGRGSPADLVETLLQAPNVYPRVIVWSPGDERKITLAPPGHWILIRDDVPFRAILTRASGFPERRESIHANGNYICCFAPRAASPTEGGNPDSVLELERFESNEPLIRAAIRFLLPDPIYLQQRAFSPTALDHPLHSPLALLTNGIGGMARMCVDLGRVKSKYDCALGANLHHEVPVDRHILVKRVRAWVNAAGFITALDGANLMSFEAGPPALWRFRASAGDGQAVEVELTADMLEGRNTILLQFRLVSFETAEGRQRDGEVRLTLRVDIEDRNFHSQTERNGGAEHHFSSHSKPLPNRPGFAFTPAADRQLRVYSSAGDYFHEGEWSRCSHYVEKTRGQVGFGDAYSPGWFEMPLARGSGTRIILTADANDPNQESIEEFAERRAAKNAEAILNADLPTADYFGRQLALATQAFVVRRHDHKSVIAGYPWFLDWGRDSLIAARGLLAGGMEEEVRQLLITFGRFEKDGTMPNTIHGEDASNRDTSDAPLWYGVVCEELAARVGLEVYDVHVEPGGRTIADVLRDLAIGLQKGTSNGIRMDVASGLLWSPPHFTWMDTNFPAATPREGYPVEIQALWIRLLRQLQNRFPKSDWNSLAEKASASFEKYFWLEQKGWFSDCLLAAPNTPAEKATVDDALRSNCLFAITLGLSSGDRARRCVEAARRHLIVPGALRSLAPLPVSVPLEVRSPDGRLLNNPTQPYIPRYEGDEDTSRKPAYHNGTAWTWTFPSFCEALAMAWDFSPESIAAAKAYLGSMDRLLMDGCIGQLPEITDGDAPHLQRGCDAQAWSATEALRVWKLLNRS
jgi:starch synthase (maltosyl-transferring)